MVVTGCNYGIIRSVSDLGSSVVALYFNHETMKIYLQREGERFKPLSEQDFDNLKRIKDGSIIYVDYKKPRNPLFHNKFMSMVRVVFENQEQYTSIESMLNIIKIELGYYDTMVIQGDHSGNVKYEVRIPKSISFASMDEMEFHTLYNRAVELVLHKFLPTVTPAELEEYVDKIVRYAG